MEVAAGLLVCPSGLKNSERFLPVPGAGAQGPHIDTDEGALAQLRGSRLPGSRFLDRGGAEGLPDYFRIADDSPSISLEVGNRLYQPDLASHACLAVVHHPSG